MTEDMKASLLQALTNDRPVTVMGLNGDTESCAYASEIAEFLKANGYNATCSWHMFFNPPVHTVKISPFNEGKEWHLVD